MAPKTGRNDPCPCGSGLKYKRCCLEKDQAAEHALLAQAAAAAAEAAAATEQEKQARFEARKHQYELAEASNAVVDLVRNGKLDEAKKA